MMNYSEYLDKNPTTLDGVDLDDATKLALFDWFQFREVCDDVKFGVFYRRAINLYAPQYNQLLRIQTVEFDPMVQQYVERLVKDKGNRASTTSGKRTQTATPNSTTTFESTRVRTPELSTETKGDTTRTPDLTVSDNGTGNVSSERSGTGKRTDNLANSAHTLTENSENGTSGNTRTTDLTDGHTAESVGMSMQGILPDSASYPTGAGEGDKMPSAGQLNWTYADSQNGTRNNDTSEDTHTGTVTDAGNSERTGNSESTVTGSNTGTQSTENAETASTDTTTANTTKTTGTDKTASTVNMTESGKETITDTNTQTHTGTDKTDSEESGTASEDTENTRKEIATGRGEAPQDLLSRARDYIMKTNAFLFLIGHLDNCFYGVYNM